MGDQGHVYLPNVSLSQREAQDAIENITEYVETLRKKMSDTQREYNRLKEEHDQAAERLEEAKHRLHTQETRQDMKLIKRTVYEDWIGKKFEWTDQIIYVRNTVFEFPEFRPMQVAAINATLSGRDVILVMPTGGGKSLVYQLPALVTKGFTVIVSPLISLIDDQLIALKERNIEAVAVNSSIAKEEIKRIYDELIDPETDIKIIYTTPEMLAKNKRFVSQLQKAAHKKLLQRVAIDEVHCCSSWGHDFRSDYKYLGILRNLLPKVPFLGVTATANNPVLADIREMVNFRNPVILTASLDRPNLFYKVVAKPQRKEAVLQRLAHVLRKHEGESGIIYTSTVNESLQLAAALKEMKFKVAPYHAQLETEQRKKIHEKWLDKKYQAVVATVAFGMGIDKPDVRFVVHHTIPKSIESLYQESGRAGRDGEPAECLILFSMADYLKNMAYASSLREENNNGPVLDYCTDLNTCRRILMSPHLDDDLEKIEISCNNMCDNCINASSPMVYELNAICADLYKIMDHSDSIGENLTLLKLVDAWLRKNMQLPGLKLPTLDRLHAELIIAVLHHKGYLLIDKAVTAYNTHCYFRKGQEIVEDIEIVSKIQLDGIPCRFIDSDSEGDEILTKKRRTE